jgi:septal ring factor EnvC (AmiA/AmiB activator)
VELLNTLITIFALIFGAGGSVMSIIYFRQNKRIKNAEADNAELDKLRKGFEILQQRVDDLYKELKETRSQLARVRAENTELYKDKNILELKNSQKKSCIHRAHECKYEKFCPVLMRQREIEDDYYSMLTEREKNKN